MLILKINNSVSTLSGLTNQHMSEFKELLSYNDKPQSVFYSKSYRSCKKYLIDKHGNFPTGLLYLVQKKLQVIPHTVVDTRGAPKSTKNFKLNLEHVPYEEQEEAANACALHSRGIVSAVTGSGKSLIAALIIHKLQVSTLIVVPSLELKRQITASLSKIFGKSNVGELGKPIAVENVDALDPSEPVNYDCLILDEFHHSGAKTYRKLNKRAWNGIYYRFGLTATPFRNAENERLLLESVLSKVIYRLSYEKAVDKKYIVPVEAYYIEIPKKPSVVGHNWPQVYSELVVNNKDRNAIISRVLNSLFEQKISTLCLVKEIAHGEALQNLTGLPFIKGDNDNNDFLLKSFNTRYSTVAIGTAGVMGEGIDTKPTEYVIIAGLGKARGQFMQWVGRALRTYPGKESAKIILIKDRSHKFTIRHFNEQVRILREEYGISPVRLDIDPN